MKYDAIIFDIDGVLIDVSQSFTKAVIEAVKYATGSNRFSEHEVALLKSVPGFNDDWHVAIAGAVWLKYYSAYGFPEYVDAINKHGSGMPGLRKFADYKLDLPFETMIARLGKEAYGGTSRCEELYGFMPASIVKPGAWQTEVPLLAPGQIEPIIDICGIVTGRSGVELQLAYELLGWELRSERVSTADMPGLAKPNPQAIIRIVNELDCASPLYIGDSRDDHALVENARTAGLDCDFCYIGKTVPPWRGVDITIESVTELLKLLEV